jgi:hypothetical protein
MINITEDEDPRPKASPLPVSARSHLTRNSKTDPEVEFSISVKQYFYDRSVNVMNLQTAPVGLDIDLENRRFSNLAATGRAS